MGQIGQVGPDGYNAAHKAAIIYAHYLEPDVTTKQRILTDVAERSRELRKEQPDNVNAWYLNALALGRYSQSISVTRALTEGIGNKIGHFLDQAISLEAQHADAHIARGHLEAPRHAVDETSDDCLDVASEHRLVRAGHAGVGQVDRPLR